MGHAQKRPAGLTMAHAGIDSSPKRQKVPPPKPEMYRKQPYGCVALGGLKGNQQEANQLVLCFETHPYGYGSKLNHQGTAGFGLCSTYQASILGAYF